MKHQQVCICCTERPGCGIVHCPCDTCAEKNHRVTAHMWDGLGAAVAQYLIAEREAGR